MSQKKVASIIMGGILFIALFMRLGTILKPTVNVIFQPQTQVENRQKSLDESVLPHYEERTRQVSHLVIHSFALSVPEMVKRLNDLKVSTHYLISTDGKITSLVPENKVAFHAGKSFWRGDISLNQTSIGIELQNPTLGQTPFPKKQLDAFVLLAKDIMNRNHISPKNVVAHSDISPTRKVDVGKSFPWREMAKHNIGLYPVSQNKSVQNKDINELLQQIGYDTTDLDKALIAFQRRFMPELIAVDRDIQHLEENLKNKEPIVNEAVIKRLNEVADSYK